GGLSQQHDHHQRHRPRPRSGIRQVSRHDDADLLSPPVDAQTPGSLHEGSRSMANPRTQRIGIFVYKDFEPIDVFGFVEAFAIARFLNQGYLSPPPHPFEVFLIGRTLANVKSINGPSVVPDWDF